MAHLFAFAVLVVTLCASPLLAASMSVKDGPALQAAIDAAIASSTPLLRVAAATYGFDHSNLVVANAVDFVLQCEEGTLFQFYPGFGVTVINSSDVWMRGFAIDYEPACYAQGVVEAFDSASRTATLRIAPEFPLPNATLNEFFQDGQENKLVYWNATTGHMLSNQPGSNQVTHSQQSADDERVYRVTAQAGFVPPVGAVGTVGPRRWSSMSAYLPSFYHGVYQVLRSSRVRTEDVTIYGGANFAMLECGGDGAHEYRRVTVAPRAPRLMSVSLDGFHSSSVRHGPLLEDCSITSIGDDFVNVHNRLFLSAEWINSHTLRLVDIGDVLGLDLQPLHLLPDARPGDTFRFYPVTSHTPLAGGSSLSLTAVTRITDAAIIANLSQAFSIVNAAPYSAGIFSVMTSAIGVWELSFAEPLPEALTAATPYSLVECLSMSGAHTIVRNNFFQDGYDNGIIAHASHFAIYGNHIARASFYGVQTTSYQSWLEGPSHFTGLVIINNTFVAMGYCAPSHIGRSGRPSRAASEQRRARGHADRKLKLAPPLRDTMQCVSYVPADVEQLQITDNTVLAK